MEPPVLEYAAPWWRVAAYAATGLAALLVAVAGFALGPAASTGSERV